MSLLSLFQKHLKTSSLIVPHEKIVIGVSGGIDSMVLLDLLSRLKSLGLELKVAHLNHNLRGEASLLDAEFVKNICRTRGISFSLKTLRLGWFKKGNLQDQARQLRYAFFRSVAKAVGARKIVTAHQADDQAETFLMRLIRGAGPQGLSAITPLQRLEAHPHDLWLVRPLLPFSRDQIFEYAQSHQIVWREDLSNQNTDYLRNKIRVELLKKIKEINPRVISLLSETIKTLEEENRWIETWIVRHSKKYIHQQPGRVEIDLGWLKRQASPIRYRVYRKMIEGAGKNLQNISRTHLDSLERMILSRNKKSRITLPRGWGAFLCGSQLVIKKWYPGRHLKKRGFFG